MVHLLSTQGEQQDRLDAALFMDQADVDTRVATWSPGVRACRESNRHPYPTMSESRLVFARWNDDYKAFERDVDCPRCGCVTRVELWEAFRRGGTTRYRKIGNLTPRYHENDLGETYLAPAGHGRISPRQVQEAIATELLGGATPAELKREILARSRGHDE